MVTARRLAFVALLFACNDLSQPEAEHRASLMNSSMVQTDAPLAAEPGPKPAAKPARARSPSEPLVPYDRRAWPHWIDADGDCQDARTEVLIAEAYEPVSFADASKCEVSGGRWQCLFTGAIIREPHLLDVDHLVPLSNAHRSGGHSWTKQRRRAYANDLAHPKHLVAVEHRANRAKGDRGPEAWLPPSEDYRCTYVGDWVEIKRRWKLSMTEAEAEATSAALAACAAGRIPALPQARPEAGEPCCKVCTKGKACGDSCVAETSHCTKPPGCACNG